MARPDSATVELRALAPSLKEALAQKLLAMGDDELLLAHRDSEWCGHAPILEEDIAFANIAQDELGHAGLWYGLLQELDGSEPDQLVFFRPAQAFRNARMLELPNGDWAFSMLRQYLFDSYEMIALEELAASALQPLAHAAAKARREEIYHLRHTQSWVQRLGLGTDESNHRMQLALEQLWPYATQLFAPLDTDQRLIDAAILPSLPELASRWTASVTSWLEASGLDVVAAQVKEEPAAGRDVHTEHLPPLIEELQVVARTDAGASW